MKVKSQPTTSGLEPHILLCYMALMSALYGTSLGGSGTGLLWPLHQHQVCGLTVYQSGHVGGPFVIWKVKSFKSLAL